MNPQTISEIVGLVAQLGPLAVVLIEKLLALGTLGPDEKANVANAIASAHSDNADSLSALKAWMAKEGFKARTVFIPANPSGAIGVPIAPKSA